MTIKYYDFGSEVIHTSERERFAAPGIVECENGKYVRREDYEAVQDALKALIDDLEMRSKWKEGRDNGVVDCGNGVYMKAKRVLGEL